MYQTYPSKINGANPIVAKIRQLAGSAIFLTFAILFSTAIVISVISSVFSSQSITDIISEIPSGSQFDSSDSPFDFSDFPFNDGSEISGAFTGISAVIGGIVGNAPSILICIFLWMLYASAKSKKNNGVDSSPVSGIKIVLITMISIVGGVILIVGLITGLLWNTVVNSGAFKEAWNEIFGKAFEDYGFGSITAALSTVMWIVFAIAAVLAIIALLYYLFLILSLNNVEKTLKYGKIKGKMFTFCAVIQILMALFTLLTVVTAFSALPLTGSKLFSFIASQTASVVSAAADVALAVFIFKYNEEIRRLGYISATPVAFAPQEPVAETQRTTYIPAAAPESSAPEAPVGDKTDDDQGQG